MVEANLGSTLDDIDADAELFSICGNDLTNAPNYGYGEFFQQMVTQVGM